MITLIWLYWQNKIKLALTSSKLEAGVFIALTIISMLFTVITDIALIRILFKIGG